MNEKEKEKKKGRKPKPIDKLTDTELIKLRNDPDKRKAVFEEIVHRKREMVFKEAQVVLQDENLADDVAQHVFTKLWEKLEHLQLDRSSGLNGYLKKMVKNRVRDIMRRRQREPRLSRSGKMNTLEDKVKHKGGLSKRSSRPKASKPVSSTKNTPTPKPAPRIPHKLRTLLVVPKAEVRNLRRSRIWPITLRTWNVLNSGEFDDLKKSFDIVILAPYWTNDNAECSWAMVRAIVESLDRKKLLLFLIPGPSYGQRWLASNSPAGSWGNGGRYPFLARTCYFADNVLAHFGVSIRVQEKHTNEARRYHVDKEWLARYFSEHDYMYSFSPLAPLNCCESLAEYKDGALKAALLHVGRSRIAFLPVNSTGLTPTLVRGLAGFCERLSSLQRFVPVIANFEMIKKGSKVNFNGTYFDVGYDERDVIRVLPKPQECALLWSCLSLARDDRVITKDQVWDDLQKLGHGTSYDIKELFKPVNKLFRDTMEASGEVSYRVLPGDSSGRRAFEYPNQFHVTDVTMLDREKWLKRV